MQRTEEVADDLPRVLLENYLMLAAAIETQNLGRLPDMLQYCQKVHQNLMEVMKQIDDAPMLAMTADQAAADVGAAADGGDVDMGPAAADPDFADPAAAPAAGATPGDQVPAGPGAAAGGQQAMHQQAAPDGRLQWPPQQQQADQQQGLQQLQQQQQQQRPAQDQLQHHHQQQSQQQHHSQQGGVFHHHHQQQQQQQDPAWPDGPSWLQHVNVSVSHLLSSLGLSQYEAVLEQQQVDMAALQLMEERHLRELGLPIGAVVKIKAALAAQL